MVREALEEAERSGTFVDCSRLSSVNVDLRYGTTNNLLGQDVYGGYQKVLLHPLAAQKFQLANDILAAERPNLRFLVFDALRPQRAQEAFWSIVAGTPQETYFAHPVKGSLHSFGFALDLSLCSAQEELDMGTGFDDLRPLAEPCKEQDYLRLGELNSLQIENRKLLRQIMIRAGFSSIRQEWWHFDALPPHEVRQNYKRVP
jgi:zinc D-Ala-D-Ala dipeptidase